MTSTPTATPRRSDRLRTALVLAAGGAALVVAALLAPRSARRAERPPVVPAVRGLDVALTSTHLAAGPAETYLTVSVTAPTAAHTQRTPASIAIVIDRSGSMRGHTFEQAKAAAIALIDKLDAGDEATLVSYSDQAVVDVPLTAADAAGKARLREAVSRLVASGNTGISAALWAGADELGRAHKDVRRVVLLSDGIPTNGITGPDELIRFAGTRAARGLSISAIGLGVEYNEHVMAGIASIGRGNYYYVERGSELAAMFARELDSLGQTVLADSELVIATAPGVVVESVLGYPFDRDGAVVRVPVADLRSAQTTKVVVRLRTELGASGAEGQELAQVTWRYRVIGGAPEERRGVARAVITTDAAAIAAGRDARAQQLVEEARTAIAIDEAAAAYTDGDLRRAQDILQTRRAEASAMARELGDADFDRRVQASSAAAQAGFAAPPASPAAAKAAAKASRADAYELAR